MNARLWIISLLVALLAGVGFGYWLHAPPAPAPSVRTAVQQSRVAHAVALNIDTVYRTQRAAEQITRTQYDTTHDTITVTRDSVRVVYVAKAVADREIRACTEVLNTCDARHAADSIEKARLHDEIAARAAMLPPRLTLSIAALVDPMHHPMHHAPSVRPEADVRLSKHLSAIAEAERGMLPRDSLHLRAGARWTF